MAPIKKIQYPDLIRAVYAKYGRGSWVYADLVVVAADAGFGLYPSVLHALRNYGVIHPVTDAGVKLKRQRHGSAGGPKLWAISAIGLKKAGVAGVVA